MALDPNKSSIYDTKIKVTLNDSTFGPGIASIMALVKETNNLSEAYRIMELSSSKGWRIIKKAEKGLGFPLFASRIGGKGGGKTELTKEGKELLEKYQNFVDELNIEAERLFEKYFSS